MQSIISLKHTNECVYNKEMMILNNYKQQRNQSRNIHLTPTYINSMIITNKYFNDHDYQTLNNKGKFPPNNISHSTYDISNNNIKSFINQKYSSVKQFDTLPQLNQSSILKTKYLSISMNNKCIVTNSKSIQNNKINPLSLKKKPLMLNKGSCDGEISNKVFKGFNRKKTNEFIPLSQLTKDNDQDKNRDKDKNFELNTHKSVFSQQTDSQYIYIKGILTKQNETNLANTTPAEEEKEKEKEIGLRLSTFINQRNNEENEKQKQREKGKYEALVLLKNRQKKRKKILSISDLKTQNEKCIIEYNKQTRKQFENNIQKFAQRIGNLKSQMFTALQEAKEDYDKKLLNLIQFSEQAV